MKVHGYTFISHKSLDAYSEKCNRSSSPCAAPALRRIALAMKHTGINRISDDAITAEVKNFGQIPRPWEDILNTIRSEGLLLYNEEERFWSFPPEVFPDVIKTPLYWRRDLEPHHAFHADLDEMFSMATDYDLLLEICERVFGTLHEASAFSALLKGLAASVVSPVLGTSDGSIPSDLVDPLHYLSHFYSEALARSRAIIEISEARPVEFPNG